jgi:predicted transcriptional regulator
VNEVFGKFWRRWFRRDFSLHKSGAKGGRGFLSSAFDASFIYQRPSTDQRTRRKRVRVRFVVGGVTMETSRWTEMATEIVAAFVSNNSVPRSELSALFETVHAAVKRLVEGGVVAPAVTEPPAREPAVSVRKSVTPDYLICLDDGRKFKSLRRHLGALGMTPEQYRAKWNLPSTYPMVAPNYTAQRSALAKNSGFGLREKPVAAVTPSAGESEGVAAPPASAGTIDVVAPETASAGTFNAAAPEPASVAKSKAKPKSKVVAAAPRAKAKRKPGRPRKASS